MDTEPPRAPDLVQPNCCSICYEPWTNKTVVQGCNHDFCFDCITPWVKEHTTCPICRGNVTGLRHSFTSNGRYTTLMARDIGGAADGNEEDEYENYQDQGQDRYRQQHQDRHQQDRHQEQRQERRQNQSRDQRAGAPNVINSVRDLIPIISRRAEELNDAYEALGSNRGTTEDLQVRLRATHLDYTRIIQAMESANEQIIAHDRRIEASRHRDEPQRHEPESRMGNRRSRRDFDEESPPVSLFNRSSMARRGSGGNEFVFPHGMSPVSPSRRRHSEMEAPRRPGGFPAGFEDGGGFDGGGGGQRLGGSMRSIADRVMSLEDRFQRMAFRESPFGEHLDAMRGSSMHDNPRGNRGPQRNLWSTRDDDEFTEEEIKFAFGGHR
jgi:hypothetical protein